MIPPADLSRRDVLRGLAGILLAGAAPFYVRPTSLMRVKPIVVPTSTLSGAYCFSVKVWYEPLTEREIWQEARPYMNLSDFQAWRIP